ncbi:MAG: TetR/AcrR family transcriptional regulator [Nocardioidaceae bacterium]
MSAKVKGRQHSHERVDGRSQRWKGHNDARRLELTVAAAAAIDALGPAAKVSEVARHAGVAKPVLYRHFADKGDLLNAVGRWGAGLLIERLTPVLLGDGSIRTRIESGVGLYLRTIEEHPGVSRLVLVQHLPARASGPLETGKATIGRAVAETFRATVAPLGGDPDVAEPWAAGVVGLALGMAEWWLDHPEVSRAELAAQMTGFVTSAVNGALATYDVEVDLDAPMEGVSP